MPSTTETGHAKNIANFQQLISFCSSYGLVYAPSKAALTVVNMQATLTAANNALAAVTTASTAFNVATNSRMDVFQPLKTLATRVINALEATDATAQTVKDARTINRKIQGQRATPKAEAPTEGATPPPDNTISASQLSYDQQVQHFARLIELVTAEASYTPNEAALTVASLLTKKAALLTANTDVVSSYTTYSNSRINRDIVLYNPLTGLVATALDAKKYVTSIFGATSPQHKQVNSLQFRKVKA